MWGNGGQDCRQRGTKALGQRRALDVRGKERCGHVMGLELGWAHSKDFGLCSKITGRCFHQESGSNVCLKDTQTASLVVRWLEIHLAMQGGRHQFSSWSRKIPHA